MTKQITKQDLRILSTKEVCHKVNLCRSTVLKLEGEGSFPKKISLTPEGTRFGWLNTDVEHWILERRKTSLK